MYVGDGCSGAGADLHDVGKGLHAFEADVVGLGSRCDIEGRNQGWFSGSKDSCAPTSSFRVPLLKAGYSPSRILLIPSLLRLMFPRYLHQASDLLTCHIPGPNTCVLLEAVFMMIAPRVKSRPTSTLSDCHNF
jgi:hypothetical protein